MIRFILMGMLLFTSACHMPTHTESRPDGSPSILVKGAPTGASIMIDGQRSGTVNGDKTQIFLTEGTHEVTIYFNGETLFERKIFVQDDSQRVIDLSE